MKIQEHVDMRAYTTFGVGGIARQFVEAESDQDIVEAIRYAKRHDLRFWFIAGGSNVVVRDGVIDGMVVRIASQELDEDVTTITCDAGVALANIITRAISGGLAGLETLSGIPGTVGGAIVGNAAAYGQTVSDRLERVLIFDVDKEKTAWLTKDQCNFSYRDSIFKREPWLVLRAVFNFNKGNKDELQKKSDEIIATRCKKYPTGLKCPGSFFKNVLAETVPTSVLSQIPNLQDFYGKVPAWYFLNEVGARGMRKGGACVASYHGNLLLNESNASFADVRGLAQELKQLVQEKFGVELEEEVRYMA